MQSSAPPDSMIRALLKTARPHQWVKNLFVAAPLLFAHRLFDGASIARAAAATAVFCLLSSAVYVLNDIVDVAKDRAHPTKRNRPIPSGRLSVRAAVVATIVLLVASLGGALLVGVWTLAAAAGYAALNLLYSFRLKHIAFLDVLSIATGFLLRVLAGSFAIRVVPSGWLLACTALLACFLGFGKRAHELAAAGPDAAAQRDVLGHYRLSHLRFALYALAIVTTGAYALYTRAGHTIEFFRTGRLVFTTPFCAVGIARFLHLVVRSPKGESPTDEMLRDVPFLANLLLWAVAVTAIIYFYP